MNRRSLMTLAAIVIFIGGCACGESANSTRMVKFVPRYLVTTTADPYFKPITRKLTKAEMQRFVDEADPGVFKICNGQLYIRQDINRDDEVIANIVSHVGLDPERTP